MTNPLSKFETTGTNGIRDLPDPADITPEMVDRYIRQGSRLRSQAIYSFLGSLFRWRRGARHVAEAQATPAAGPSVQPEPQPLLNALSAMRSAMEVLRDVPELSKRDRIRFADMALTEEARVERMLNELLNRRAGTV